MPRNSLVVKLSLVIAGILTLTGCQSASSPQKKAQEAEQSSNVGGPSKILMVIAPHDFRDEEYQEPRDIFEDNNYQVDVASIQTGTAVGVNGTEVEIDTTTDQASPNDYEAVVFVGGPGMAQITKDETLAFLAQKFYQGEKLTTAICVAPAILARAGILENKKATSFPNAQEDLESGGAEFTGDKVTVDGRIVTANGPEAATEFAQTVVSELD